MKLLSVFTTKQAFAVYLKSRARRRDEDKRKEARPARHGEVARRTRNILLSGHPVALRRGIRAGDCPGKVSRATRGGGAHGFRSTAWRLRGKRLGQIVLHLGVRLVRANAHRHVALTANGHVAAAASLRKGIALRERHVGNGTFLAVFREAFADIGGGDRTTATPSAEKAR